MYGYVSYITQMMVIFTIKNGFALKKSNRIESSAKTLIFCKKLYTNDSCVVQLLKKKIIRAGYPIYARQIGKLSSTLLVADLVFT